MCPAILQWFQSILFFLASPAGAAAPAVLEAMFGPLQPVHDWNARRVPQMLGFNLGRALVNLGIGHWGFQTNCKIYIVV